MRIFTIFALLGLIYSPLTRAQNISQAGQEIFVFSGFMTAESYLRFNGTERTLYVMGVIDGLTVSPLLSRTTNNANWLQSCVENKTSSQLEAMITKRVRDTPAEWHKAFHWIVLDELMNVCSPPRN